MPSAAPGPEVSTGSGARKSVQAPVPEVSTGSGARKSVQAPVPGSQYRLRCRKSVQAPVPEVSTGSGPRKSVQAPVPGSQYRLRCRKVVVSCNRCRLNLQSRKNTAKAQRSGIGLLYKMKSSFSINPRSPTIKRTLASTYHVNYHAEDKLRWFAPGIFSLKLWLSGRRFLLLSFEVRSLPSAVFSIVCGLAKGYFRQPLRDNCNG